MSLTLRCMCVRVVLLLCAVTIAAAQLEPPNPFASPGAGPGFPSHGPPSPNPTAIPPLKTSITVTEHISADAPAAVTTLAPTQLALSPGVNLDDRLRLLPGFSLFRRSSSLVANPGTQASPCADSVPPAPAALWCCGTASPSTIPSAAGFIGRGLRRKISAS